MYASAAAASTASDAGKAALLASAGKSLAKARGDSKEV
jgi:hypothetical protein